MKRMIQRGAACSISIWMMATALVSVAQASQLNSLSGVWVAQTGNTCGTSRSEAAERAVQELTEQITQAINDRRIEDAASTLSQALRAAQTLPNGPTKASLVEVWIANVYGQPSLLAQIMTLSLEADRPASALAILPHATQFVQTLGSGYSRLKTTGLVAIANHYQALGQSNSSATVLTEALRSSQYIRGAEFLAPALTSIAQGYGAIAQPANALPLLDRALQAANTIQSTTFRNSALSQIAVTLATVGNLDRALQVAQTIQRVPYYGSNALRVIVTQAIQQGQLDRALQVTQSIPELEAKAIALAEVAGAYGKAGQAERASQVLAQATTIARSARNQPFTVLGEVVKQYARSGQPDAARTTAQTIPDLTVKVQTLAAIARVYADQGQADVATATLTQAIQAVQTVRDINEQANLLNPILEDYRSSKHYGLALQAAQALPVDEFSGREGALSSIARSAIADQQLELALAATQAISQNWNDYRNRGFEGIAIAYAKSGQFDRALQIADLADNFGSYSYQVRTLAAIAGAYFNRGQSTQAEAVLTRALTITNGFDTVNQKTDGLVAIAIQYAAAGQNSRAAQLQQQVLDLAATISDESTQSYVLREAIGQYLAANQYVVAIQAAQAIRETGERINNLTTVINQAIQASQYERALQAARAITLPESKTRFLLTIARRYLQIAQPTQANAILTEAFEVAKTISDPESKTIVVRVDYDANGNPIPLTTVDDDNDRGSLLEAIALAHGQAGQYNRAVQVAQAIQDTAVRNALLQRLACYR